MLTSSIITSLFAASAFAVPQLLKRAPQVVTVGFENGLVFKPEALSAAKGDQIQFVFSSKNHSVVQSSFAHPCGPLANGFNSGFQLVAAGTTEDKLPTVTYTVTTEQSVPLWFYCSQAKNTPNSHCHAGMVFSINCPNTGPNSFDNFKKSAMADPAATLPATPTASATDVITPLAPEPTYPGITYPPAPSATTLTDVITLGTNTWTTTYASYPNSPKPTPSAENGTEIRILVGANGDLTFTPSVVTALPRDVLVFEFQAKNHSVVQSSFAAPCSPFLSAVGQTGVNSGFMPVPDPNNKPTFRVTVNDTVPLWFYCGQTGHCGKGMVLSVNSDEKGQRSSAAFQKLAKEINGTSSTGTTSGSAPSESSKPDSAARLSVGGLAVAGVVALFATLL